MSSSSSRSASPLSTSTTSLSLLTTSSSLSSPSSSSSSSSFFLSSSSSINPRDHLYKHDGESAVFECFYLSSMTTGIAYCIVKNCKAEYKYVVGGTTSSLIKHLRRAPEHPIKFKIKTNALDNSNSTEKDIERSSDCVGHTLNARQREALEQLLVDHWIEEVEPFTKAECPTIKNIFKYLTKNTYEGVDRKKMTMLCDDRYESIVNVLYEEMKNQAVSITADAATLNNGQAYITCTGHYINDDWVMRDVVLAVQVVNESQTGSYTANLLNKVAVDWPMSGTSFPIVTDNGANFVSGAKRTTIPDTFRCFIHTAQLALKDAAAESLLKELTNKVLPFITAVRISDNLQNSLNIQMEFLETLDAEMKNADEAKENEENVEIDEEIEVMKDEKVIRIPLELKEIPISKFNSLSYVLERFLRLRRHITVLLLNDPSLREYELTEAEWHDMKGYASILIFVRQLCEKLEASKTPTVSLIIPTILALRNSLISPPTVPIPIHAKSAISTNLLNHSTFSINVQAFCMKLREKVDAHWPLVNVIENVTILSSLMLDPRVSQSTLMNNQTREEAKYCLKIMFDSFDNFKFTAIRSEIPQPASNPLFIINEEKSDEHIAKKMKVKIDSLFDTIDSGESDNEISRYFRAENTIKMKECPIEWWRKNKERFPKLARMAKTFLPVAASSAAERACSIGGQVDTNRRQSLDESRVARLIFCKKNSLVYRNIIRKK